MSFFRRKSQAIDETAGPTWLERLPVEAAFLLAHGPPPDATESRRRYLALTVAVEANNGELKVQTAGACTKFDADARLSEASAQAENEQSSRFEHDTVVQ